MDKINGNYLNQQNPDFPLACETLQYLSNNDRLCELLGNIAGDKIIIVGCALNQEETERTDGYVFIRTVDFPDGEILPFEGGAVANGFHLVKEDINVTAGDFTYPKAYTKRSLVAGGGDEQFTWDDFVELTTTKALKAALEDLATSTDKRLDAIVEEPFGIVKMWAGISVPLHYHLCDGTELRIPQSESEPYWGLYQEIGTAFNNDGHLTQGGYFALPNLSGRFIVGRGTSDREFQNKEKGGASQVTLTTAQIPSHNHTASFIDSESDNGDASGTCIARAIPERSQTNTSIITIGNTVGGEAHNNLPPYYTLAYIIRIE